MMSAIATLDENARVDVIILTRGVGSENDLRVFNETPLCRVISNTETPVVVGVGHENDRTLADEVADRRVMTPTHAGEIVPEKEALESEIETKISVSRAHTLEQPPTEWKCSLLSWTIHISNASNPDWERLSATSSTRTRRVSPSNFRRTILGWTTSLRNLNNKKPTSKLSAASTVNV